MDLSLDGECPLVMASQDVQSYASDQIGLGIHADLLGAFALVIGGNDAIQGILGGRLGGINGNMELEME